MKPADRSATPTLVHLCLLCHSALRTGFGFESTSYSFPSSSVMNAGSPCFQINRLPINPETNPKPFRICGAVILLLSFVAFPASQMSLTHPVHRTATLVQTRRCRWNGNVRAWPQTFDERIFVTNLRRAQMLFRKEHEAAMGAFTAALHPLADCIPGRLKSLIRDSEYHGRRSERLAKYIEAHGC